MRRILLLSTVVLLLISGSGQAQSPPGINYQGIARDLDGKPLASKDIAIKISIVKESPGGEIEFSEVHALQTNSFGLFTLVIGTGSTITGDFRFISWALGKKWLRVEMDQDGGNAFQTVGSQQFMSVPYAFYAQYSGSGGSLTAGQGLAINNGVIQNTGDADSNPANEFNTSLTLGADKKLTLTDGGGSVVADLSPLVAPQSLSNVLTTGNDAATQRIRGVGAPVDPADAATKAYVDSQITSVDGSSSNEIQSLSLTGKTLSISGGNSVDLTAITPDAQNLSATSSGTTRTIAITNGTSAVIDVADNDNNPSNEIQDLALSGNTLSLTGDATTVNLAPYLDNTDAQNLSSTASGTNRTIAITGGTSTTIDVADNDNSVTNEIQDLTLTGNTLSLSSDATPVNLAPYLDNTDNQGLSSTSAGTNRTISITNGTATTIDVADNDNSVTNELQTLSYSTATKNLSLSSGNTVNIPETQTLTQVLTLGSDAGTQRITNLGAPTAATDATTRKYVDDADAVLAARIATNYAFKVDFNFTNSTAGSLFNQLVPFTEETFDDFNVAAGASFTAPENGTYIFIVDGIHTASIAGSQLSIAVGASKFAVPIVQPWGGLVLRYNATHMLRLNAGQTVTIVGDNVLPGAVFTGTLSGHKL